MRLFAPLIGLITLITVMPLPLTAAPLTLAEAEQLALARDAARERILAEAEAEGERAIASGALPDPEVSLGLQNVPVGSFALDEDPMSMVMLGVEQMIPPGGVREYLRERGLHLAEATAVLAADRERQVRYAVRDAWLAAQTAAALTAAVNRVRAETASLMAAAEGRYATGGGRQSDYLTAKLKLDRLTDELLRAEEQLAVAQASLRRWLGEAPEKTSSANLPEPPGFDVLLAGLQAHPLLVSADARVAAGQSAEAIAGENYGPRWKVGASYGYRRGMNMAGEPADDMASIMVGFSLPLFTKNRQDRELSAARSETRAARFNREDMLRELSGRLDAAWRRHRDTSRQLALYSEQLLPDAQRVVDATEQAYADNAAGFDELAEAYIDLFEMDARRLELAERVQRARAEIYYLTGEPQ